MNPRTRFAMLHLIAAISLLMLSSVSSYAASFCGGASWYAMTSLTASGERANPNAMTAAHKSLPFGTMVVVENLSNKRKVKVRINDRGPFVRGRVIDVSKAAAARLGMVRSGTARVKVTTSGKALAKARIRRSC